MFNFKIELKSDRVVDQIQAENHFTRTEVEKLIHFVVKFFSNYFNI